MSPLRTPEEHPSSVHQEPIYCLPAQNRTNARQVAAVQEGNYTITNITFFSGTYRQFGCTEVHREINTVEDPFWHIGPVSCGRTDSSSSGKKGTRTPSHWICLVFTWGTLWRFWCSGALKQSVQLIRSLIEFIHGSILPPLQKRTSERVVSPTRWQISAVFSCKHHRRPKTLHLPTFQHPHSRPTAFCRHFSGTHRRYTRPSLRGTSGEMEGGEGIQSEVRSCAAQQRTAAQPLLSSLLPGEKLTNGI